MDDAEWPSARWKRSREPSPEPSGEKAPQALVELDLGLPAEQLRGAGDVGLAHLRVVDRQRLEDDLGLASPVTLDDRLGELEQRELVRVADVDRQVLAGLGEAR